ncbi:hypothetical protein [Stagnihabitans tardus]|uniref:Uncharacterized protein n=1 Tax=Stagnihabitans tardus TaxID=2699202 RepID=A0AAE5BY13_9RHOB|nr:hypothetical protein [Stagnihabitans tardus]
MAAHLLQAQSEGPERARLAIDRAREIAATQPDKAMELVRSAWKEANDAPMYLLAEFMTEEGNEAAAREILTLVRQARSEDPNPSAKVLDLLFTAGEMAANGYPDLARETHVIAVGFLPGDVSSPVGFSDELRLARLMGLYGWPEAAEPWFSATYDRITEIPEGSFERGMVLAQFMSVARIIDNISLFDRASADLAAFYVTASPEVRAQVQSAEVSALAESGEIEAAKTRAKAYGTTLADSMASGARFFLDYESDYTPGLFRDTRDRYDRMVAALETDTAKGAFLVALARKLMYKKIDPEFEVLLPRVTDPAARFEMVAEGMAWLARDKGDPKAAADLYFSEVAASTSDLREKGSIVGRYSLALTAEGLWDKGDIDRAKTLTAIVLDMWTKDDGDNRSPETLLIRAMAQAGQDALITPWLEGARLPKEHAEILIWAARGKAAGGDFDMAEDYISRARATLEQVPSEPPVVPKWWPKDRPMPTERDVARARVESIALEIITEMAQQDQVDRALRAWALADKSQAWAWRPALEITRAETRAGRAKEADAMRISLIDDLLSGAMAPRGMAGLIAGIAQDIAAP